MCYVIAFAHNEKFGGRHYAAYIIQMEAAYLMHSNFPAKSHFKASKDSPKDKARPKYGPRSGTLGPIHIIFTRVHLLYCAGSVLKFQLDSTKTH